MFYKLKLLYVKNTKIKEIPMLPNLESLGCSGTKIKKLPVLPSLTTLDCSNTKIAQLPVLPSLTLLECSNTRIARFPALPKLEHLFAENCRFLLEVPSNAYVKSSGSVWCSVEGFENVVNKRTRKLISLQRWFRQATKRRAFQRWVQTEECMDWFYRPGGIGEKRARRRFKEKQK